MPVIFDPVVFVGQYPQFAAYNTANPGMLTNFFNESTMFLSNVDYPGSIVKNLTRRQQLLFMLVAHIAILNGALSADGQFNPVGRTSMVQELDVRVVLDYSKPSVGSQAWFTQTQPGAMYWAATVGARCMFYVSGKPKGKPLWWR